MIKDVYQKTGETFYRPKNGKEISKDVKGFFKFSWRKANFVYINLFIFLIYIICAFSNFNWARCTNILYSSVTIGITAIGRALIIIGGDIDLSAGSIFALVAGLSARVYNSTYSAMGKNSALALIITLLFAVVFGFLLGGVNGFFVGYLHRPSFIVTLATRLVYRSLIVYTLSVQDGHPSTFRLDGYAGKGDTLYTMGNLSFASISLVGIIFILLVLFFYLLATRTKFGRKIYAVGSNSKAASLIGIHVSSVKALVFAIEGLLIGFAAFLQLGIRGNIDPSAAGKSYELYAIASNVLGGISMAGGSGNILGVLFGALAFQTIDKIIAALHLSPNLNDTIKGIILLIAVVFQILRFSPEGFNRLLVRLHLRFNSDLDVELEGEKQKKLDKIEKQYRKKIKAVNNDSGKDPERIKKEIFALLKEQDDEKKTVGVVYDQKIQEAKKAIEEHKKLEATKLEEKKKKEAQANEAAYQASKNRPVKETKSKEGKKNSEEKRVLSDKEKSAEEREQRLKQILLDYQEQKTDSD